MDELSILDRLIKKTLEDMDSQERLDFIERLFTSMPPASQERVLVRLLRESPAADEDEPDEEFEPRHGSRHSFRHGPPRHGAYWPGPPFMRHAMRGRFPRNIAPWRMLSRMMIDVDSADWLDALDPTEPARVFGALGDETRIKIIKVLSVEGELAVDDLTRILRIPQSTLSHHLRVLKDADLVSADRRGRNVYYSIAALEDEGAGGEESAPRPPYDV